MSMLTTQPVPGYTFRSGAGVPDPVPADHKWRRALHSPGQHRGRFRSQKGFSNLNPQPNLALGGFSYEAGIEEQSCDMVTGKLGREFPWWPATTRTTATGDVENFVRCLPNKLPGMKGAAFSNGCLADTDMAQVEGTVFATIGMGGVGLYEINSKESEMVTSRRPPARTPTPRSAPWTSRRRRLS